MRFALAVGLETSQYANGYMLCLSRKVNGLSIKKALYTIKDYCCSYCALYSHGVAKDKHIYVVNGYMLLVKIDRRSHLGSNQIM